MAKVSIHQIQLSVIIGTKPCEREKPQNITLDLSFIYDSDQAQKSDDLADAVDYEAITQEIREKTKKTTFFLVEKLTNFILDIIMTNKSIKKATVTVFKPNAIKNTKSISTELSRER